MLERAPRSCAADSDSRTPTPLRELYMVPKSSRGVGVSRLSRGQEAQAGRLAFVHHPFERAVGRANRRHIRRRRWNACRRTKPASAGPGSSPSPLLIIFSSAISSHSRGWKVSRSSSSASAWRACSDLRRQRIVRHRERPDPFVDAARHLVDRQAVGRDRVPDADEIDFGSRVVLARPLVLLVSPDAAPALDDGIAQVAHAVDDADLVSSGFLTDSARFVLVAEDRSL